MLAITTPNQSHRPVARDALGRGLDLIFVVAAAASHGAGGRWTDAPLTLR